MYLCYVDESGTYSIPGNTSHYILAGISIPIWYWRKCEEDIERIKNKYDLKDTEIHTAWLLRKYLEQSKVSNFDQLDYKQRRSQIQGMRTAEILRLQRSKNPGQLRQTTKNFEKTKHYIHLSYEERYSLVKDLAQCISSWGFARLFAECIDKVHFDPSRTNFTVYEQAFEQLVTRFELFLQNTSNPDKDKLLYGILIHDNNETVAKRLTGVMKQFHYKGTFWTEIRNIIETPLFVDSQLTSMIQIADICSYALRRYLENDEKELFDFVFKRAHRKDGIAVGVRHFTAANCLCVICSSHRKC